MSAPAGGSVVSSQSVSVGNAPMVDAGNATIDASTDSTLTVAYNASGSAGSASDLGMVVSTPDGTQVDSNGSLASLSGNAEYTIAATELSVNETLTVELYNLTANTVLASDTATITVQAPRLSSGAATNVSSGPVGSAVKFDGSGSSLASTYAWSVTKNGSTVASAGSKNFTHTFTSAGLYTATLTVMDGTGHVDTNATRVAIGDAGAPSAALEGYPSTATVDESVDLYAGGSTDDLGIETYEWDWTGDGSYEKTTDASSPNGGVLVSHSYSTTGTKTPTVRVTDYAGNTATAQVSIDVRPKPKVTASSVTWTGNGTNPGSIDVKANTGGGMLVFYLHPSGSPSAMDLSGAGADTSTEVWVNLTVENYDPDAVMGGANLHEWNVTPNSNGAGNNFSARLQPVDLQRNTSFTGMDPSQWKSKYDRADLAIQAGVYLGTFDVPDGSSVETNMTGATLTSDAQAFMPPRYDQTSGTLNYSVAAPHWRKNLDGNGNKVQNTGFYEAVIPSGLVSWMGIGNPDELAGTYRSGGSTTDLTNMEVVSRANGDLYINVTGIHYSAGTVSLAKDTEAPTASLADASGTAGQSVTLDASGSSDNRKISTYEWDWDGDGSYDSSTSSSSASHTYASSDDYTVKLRVTDGAGNVDTDTATASIQASGGGGADGGYASSSTEGTTTPETETATETSTKTAVPGTTHRADSTGSDATATDGGQGGTDETGSPTPGPTSTSDEPSASGTPTETSGQPGFGPVAALVGMLAAGLMAVRRR